MTDTKPNPRREKFTRLAATRTNAVLDKLDILGNLSNKQAYEYSDEDIKRIFAAILKKARDTRALFSGGRKTGRFEL